jgi:hypothetical protein
MTEMPRIGNGTQHCENKRKNSFLNYESPALTAELQAQFAIDLIMANRLLTNPETIGVVCATPTPTPKS